MRALALLALIPLVTTAASASAQDTHVVPTEMCGDYFFVPVVLGKDAARTLWMLLDTGSSVTVVDPESVERISDADLSAGQRVSLIDATSGPLSFSRLPTRARDLDHLSLTLGREIDGILGYNAFAKVLLTLDYPEREVRVRVGELPHPDDTTIFRTIRRTDRPFLPLQVGDRETLVLIDSGSRGGLTLDEDVDWGWEQEPRLVGATARIDRIELRHAGRTSHDAVFARALIQTPIIDLTDGTQLLGTHVMRHFEFTFDQQNKRVQILKSGEGPISLPERRGLGIVMRPAGDVFELARVIPDGPGARAGLQEGDEITHFNGVAVLGRGCEASLGESAGASASLRLTIRRGAATFDVDVAREILLR
jgi:hypothetical protein